MLQLSLLSNAEKWDAIQTVTAFTTSIHEIIPATIMTTPQQRIKNYAMQVACASLKTSSRLKPHTVVSHSLPRF